MVLWCHVCRSACRLVDGNPNGEIEVWPLYNNHGRTPTCSQQHPMDAWPEAEAVYRLVGWPAVRKMALERRLDGGG